MGHKQILNIVLVVVVVFWAVVGVILWIPLLARMTVFYALMVVASAYTTINLENARSGLESAITFYSDGFRRITSSLLGPREDKELVRPVAPSEWVRIGVEGLFTLVFWTLTLYLLGGAFGLATNNSVSSMGRQTGYEDVGNPTQDIYVLVADVSKELDCNDKYNDEQRKANHKRKYYGKRVRFEEEVSKVEMFNNVLHLAGKGSLPFEGWFTNFHGRPTASLREREKIALVQKGEEYEFDCKITGFCEKHRKKSMEFRDCVISTQK